MSLGLSHSRTRHLIESEKKARTYYEIPCGSRFQSLADSAPTERIFLSAAAGLGFLASLVAVLGILDGYEPTGFVVAFVVLLLCGLPGCKSVLDDLLKLTA